MTKQLTINQHHIAHYANKLQYEIDSWDLAQAIKRGDPLVVIDARSIEAYQTEHIPGAMSFPWRTINKESTQQHLNPEILYVTYCDGIGCNASTKCALKLAELGYQVKELIGGIQWWKQDGYAVDQSTNTSSNIDCGCDG